MVSVIIPTLNRARLLEETVHSFLACEKGSIDYELVLIDNNSSDKTREKAKRISEQIPQVRYVVEPILGANQSRNCGIRESRGEIVAFVDDDVYFSACWLTALVSAFERHPDAACIGGKVVPHFEVYRPSWIDDDQLWIYGVTRYGEEEREIRPPEIPIGCNMAFRRWVFEQIGYFHPRLGRKGESLFSGDENHLLVRIANAGLKTIYSPDVQVSHRILPARTTRHWALRRYYWQGVSDVALKQVGDDPLSRAILTKKAIGTLLALLRGWRDIAGLLSMRSGRKGGIPFLWKQISICYNLGSLRQMIAESLRVRGGIDK